MFLSESVLQRGFMSVSNSILLISPNTSANYTGTSSCEIESILKSFYGEVFLRSYLGIWIELDNLELLLPVNSSVTFCYRIGSIVEVSFLDYYTDPRLVILTVILFLYLNYLMRGANWKTNILNRLFLYAFLTSVFNSLFNIFIQSHIFLIILSIIFIDH